MSAMQDIDTGNYQAVSFHPSGSIVVMAPQKIMTAERALVHAAWIVALADPMGDGFTQVLEAVRNT